AALATLHHPHVVSIVELGETEEGIPFLVMEVVEGPSLREVMRSPLFDAPAALLICGEADRATDSAHRPDVTHRDRSAENILPALRTEFVEGPSQRQVIRSPPFDAAAALRIFGEVARAIDYARRHNVIRRDLKPKNILRDEPAGGIAKVSDFGLAAFLQDEPS